VHLKNCQVLSYGTEKIISKGLTAYLTPSPLLFMVTRTNSYVMDLDIGPLTVTQFK